MYFSEFEIGAPFYCAGKAWRCTDKGQRVIVAICLEPVAVESLNAQGERGTKQDSDPSWFNGPPYAVAEAVFDEYDQPACSTTLMGDEAQ